MASTSPPGPTIFSHFLIFSLLSSPRSMKSYWCYTHTKNMCFYLPSGLHNFSQQYFSFLLQNRLFSKEFSMSLFWFKVDWKTRWKKRALFLVSMLQDFSSHNWSQASIFRHSLMWSSTASSAIREASSVVVEGSVVYSRCSILRSRIISISSQKGQGLSGGPDHHFTPLWLYSHVIVLILRNSYSHPQKSHQNILQNLKYGILPFFSLLIINIICLHPDSFHRRCWIDTTLY